MFLIAIIFTTIAIIPFCALNYSKSGYFVTDARLVGTSKKFYYKIFPSAETKVEKNQSKKSANYYTFPKEKLTLSHNISSLLKGAYIPYCILAIIGLFLIIRKKQWKNDYYLLFSVTFLQNFIYFATVCSSRYFLYMVPLFMMFTVTGIDFIKDFIKKHIPTKTHSIIVLLCLLVMAFEFCYGLKSAFSRDEIKYKEVGQWIKEYNKKHFPNRKIVVYAPMTIEVAYWSNGINTERYEMPKNDPKTFTGFDIAVVSSKRHYNMKNRKDLELIPNTPHNDSLYVFKLKNNISK
jgi:hypothetical protein